MQTRRRVWLLQMIPLVRTAATGVARLDSSDRPTFPIIVQAMREQPAA